MTDVNDSERRLKAMRDAPKGAADGLRVVSVGQAWMWRMAGPVVALPIALLILALTLSAVPDGAVSVVGMDKVFHFLAFAALIFPLILTDSRRWVWAVPLVIALGGAIELIQPSVGRTAEWLDWGADITGVLAGAALAEILHDRIRARFFAVPADPQAGDDTAARRDVLRAELMAELRTVLREELSATAPATRGPQPSDATPPPPPPPTQSRH